MPSANVPTATEPLSCNPLRMEEQKERRTLDPSDNMGLLCQPWDAYLWTCGYVGKKRPSLVKATVDTPCLSHGSKHNLG